MFVYDVPCVDYFGVLCPLNHVSSLIKPLEDEGEIGSYKAWMKFLRACLVTLKDCTDWGPNLNGFLIYVGSIPIPYGPAERFVVIKQSGSGDNGDSYVISEAEMPHLEEYFVESKYHNTIPVNLELESFIREVIAKSVLY